MEFKRAKEINSNDMIGIIRKSQEYLRKQGIDQWQNNYPNIDTIKNDIQNKYGYILLKDNIIVGTVAVIFEEDKTYHSIYNGNWITSGPYVVIHRIAINPDYHGLGLGSEIIEQVEKMCKDKGINSIRIDTHKENQSMQKLLIKNGFQYCGIIYLEYGAERMAFEKIVKG